MSLRIAVVGSNMTDLVTSVNRMPAWGETLEAPHFTKGFGGKGANQAAAAARLGAEVVMVSKVGDDIFGDDTLRNFVDLGIDTTHVGRVPGVSSGVAPIFVEPDGENAILIIKGANNHLLPIDVEAAAEALKSCDLILMQMEIPIETIYHTIAWARKNGIETLLNPAPAAADLDPTRIGGATFLVPNESELALLTGLPVTTDGEIETAARALIAHGLRTVIVTMGGRGAMLVTAGAVHHVLPVQVTPKDTTGAGDAFIGSFARFYIETRDLEKSLTLAAHYAADTITRPGAQVSYADTAGFKTFLGTTLGDKVRL